MVRALQEPGGALGGRRHPAQGEDGPRRAGRHCPRPSGAAVRRAGTVGTKNLPHRNLYLGISRVTLQSNTSRPAPRNPRTTMVGGRHLTLSAGRRRRLPRTCRRPNCCRPCPRRPSTKRARQDDDVYLTDPSDLPFFKIIPCA